MNFKISKLLIETVISGFIEEALDVDFSESNNKCAISSMKYKTFRNMWFF